MRPGYLTVLAARTLGVSPVLRPATPSRFEPEGPQAGLGETMPGPPAGSGETVPGPQAGPAQNPAPRRAPDRADDTLMDAALAADPPLLGFFEPGNGEERPPPEGWAAPGAHESGRGVRPGTAPAPAPVGPQTSAQATAVPPGLTAPPSGAAAVPPGLTAPPSGRAASGAEPAGPGQPAGEPAEAAVPPGSRATGPADVIEATLSRQQAQAAGQGGEPGEARSPEPAIVVRIGRVDVRAVPPPPPPPPRSRAPAGPSLAEHLHARDRGRR